MRILRPADTYRDGFSTVGSSGAVNADSTPTAALYRNGTVDGAVTVTVTNVTTGAYKLSATVPVGYAAGDDVQVLVVTVVGGLTYRGWLEPVTLSAGTAGAGAVALTTTERTSIAAAWGASVVGNSRTRDMYLQGLTNKLEYAADGATWTLYSTDDTTSLATGTASRLGTTVGGLRAMDPT